MTGLPVFLILAVVACAAITLRALLAPQRRASRVVIATLFGGFVVVLYGALYDLTGRPRLSTLELLRRDAPEADVLAADIVPDKVIRLWLRVEGDEEPLAYRMPWDSKMAQQLQEAMRQYGQEGGPGVKMRMPFEPSLDPRDPPRFYESPQPALPPKDLPKQAPIEVPGADA